MRMLVTSHNQFIFVLVSLFFLQNDEDLSQFTANLTTSGFDFKRSLRSKATPDESDDSLVIIIPLTFTVHSNNSRASLTFIWEFSYDKSQRYDRRPGSQIHNWRE